MITDFSKLIMSFVSAFLATFLAQEVRFPTVAHVNVAVPNYFGDIYTRLALVSYWWDIGEPLLEGTINKYTF